MSTQSKDPEFNRLQPIKIHFSTKQEDRKGFYTLMVSGMPVQALQNNRYVIVKAQKVMLDEKGIRYEID